MGANARRHLVKQMKPTSHPRSSSQAATAGAGYIWGWERSGRSFCPVA